jgi:membrane-bound inhibitor of C-type lysozyme
MATSLLDEVHALMTAPLLSATARSLGASEEAAAAGLVGSSAAMLAALAGRAGEAEGIGPFFKLITGPANNGSVLQEPRLAVATSPQSPLGATAGRFLSGLFRSQLPTVANTLAQSTGLRPGSGGSLLSIAAPLVLGVLGNRVRSEGLDAAGLAGLLAADRDRIMRDLPSGLTSIPALGALFDLNDTSWGIAVARSAAAPRAPTAARTRRVLPVLAVFALAVLLWGVSRSGGPPALEQTVGALDSAPGDTVESLAMAAGALRFRCGDQQVTVQQVGDRTVLTTESGTFDLHRVEAASGARFEAFTDGSTTFWSKGDRATLAIRGKSYPECLRQT